LRSSFRRIPRWASERIDSAHEDRLKEWIARVPGAKSIDAVFGRR